VKLTCAIIEDEEISRMMIEGLAEKTGLLSIQASFSSAQEAAVWLNDHEVDLLFLDIEIPDFSGFDLLKGLNYKPEVIVVSGNPNYAAQAYELSLTDYLVKPVKDYSRFLTAVTKVVSRKKLTSRKARTDEALFVKIDSLLLKLNVDEIHWIEAFGDYVKIQTLVKQHTVYSTLKKIEDKLDNKKFVRVHRSFIVNISKITNIDPSNLQIDKQIIPISGTYKDELLNRISIL
jgi:DNA-binding LytR/AlgR family response regulator